MKWLFTLVLVPIMTSNECCNSKTKTTAQTDNTGTSKENTGLPDCIKKIIDDASKQSRAERPVQIDEYTYKGNTVYYLTAPCCDQYNMLYDTDCKSICAPSGGFTGRGDGKCKDFDSTAKHVKMIWKAPEK